MPALANRKHEAFAAFLARGDVTQVQAYVMAGFKKQAASASKLAKSPPIVERVKELTEMFSEDSPHALLNPMDDNIGTLKELGVTVEWIAKSYKDVYKKSLENNQFAPANSALASLHKILETEQGSRRGEDDDREMIPLTAMTNMMKDIAAIMTTVKNENNSDDMKDVTPQSNPASTNLIEIVDIEALQNDHTE